MINGSGARGRAASAWSTRAIPGALDAGEPERVGRGGAPAWVVAHAVVTQVARDDLDDGGAAQVRRDDRRDPPAQARACAVEVLIPDCKGDPARDRRDLRRAARGLEPQPRDGAAPAASRAPVGWLRPQPRRARPRQGGGSRDEVGDHRRHGRDRRRGRRRPWPTCVRSTSTSSRSASTCGRRPITFRSPDGFRLRRSSGSAARARSSGSRTSSPRRSPAPATTRALRPRLRDGHSANSTWLGVVPCRHDRTDFRVRRPAGASARGDDRQGRRRAAALGRRRPALADRLRGDAARAADHARRPPRRRRDARRAPARGAASRRATGRVHDPAVGRDRRSRRDRRRSRRRGEHRRDRRHHVGALPPRVCRSDMPSTSFTRAVEVTGAAAGTKDAARDRGAAAGRRGGRSCGSLPGRRHRPRRAHRGGGVGRDRPDCWPRAITR